LSAGEAKERGIFLDSEILSRKEILRTPWDKDNGKAKRRQDET
jgi:hypothetical protein